MDLVPGVMDENRGSRERGPPCLRALLLARPAGPDDVRLLLVVREPQEPAVLALPLLLGVGDGVAVDALLAERRLWAAEGSEDQCRRVVKQRCWPCAPKRSA